MTEKNISSLMLKPITKAAGSMNLPGSKSISNRALLMAALSRGNTILRGLLDSDDTKVMIDSLQKCGVAVNHLNQNDVEVHGVYPFPNRVADLFLGNAGTAIRPLTAALALMGGEFKLHGVPRMHERPIGDLVDALRFMGAKIEYLGNPGYPPMQISTGNIDTTKAVSVKGNVSSQFLTALLLAAPIVSQAGDVVINVNGELISKPYIEITMKLMAKFGVHVKQSNWQEFTIPANSEYKSPNELHVEGDASSASYFMALGLLGGGPLKINGVGSSSTQGDVNFADVVKAMGADVNIEENSITVSSLGVANGMRLKSFDMDFNLIPDAAMTAAVLALFADAPCTLRNIASWRVKETDRIDAMHAELVKLGATVESGPDWICVYPIADGKWSSAQIETYDDHRMAMCFSLASFGPNPITILDPNCVAKTFPEYFNVFETIVS